MQLDINILLARAKSAFTPDVYPCVFKVEILQEQNEDQSAPMIEIGHYSTFERAILEVIALADGGILLADEGENPYTGVIEPYIHFADLEDLMCEDFMGEINFRLSLKAQYDDGPGILTDVVYVITLVRLLDNEIPGT